MESYIRAQVMGRRGQNAKNEFFILFMVVLLLLPLLRAPKSSIEKKFLCYILFNSRSHERERGRESRDSERSSPPETIHSKLNFMGELNVHKSFLLSMFSLSVDTTMITNMHGMADKKS